MKLSLSDFEQRNFLVLTFAGIINAIGVTIFLAPVKLYDTGISGTSMLLGQLTPSTFSLSLFLLILNIPLFLYGLNETRPCFYYLCDLYSCYLFHLCMADRRCSSDQCEHRFSTCWNRSSSLFLVWWFDHGNSQWIFSSIWRSYGWN